MLARSCKRALVVLDPHRDRAGQWIWERNRPDLFVLDDGMQHLRVERDLDLVLLSPQDLKEDWNSVLPSGPWREGKKALERADAFLLNVPPGREEEMFARLRAGFEPGRRPVFTFSMETVGLKGMDGSAIHHPPETPYLLISGVGRPERVEYTAASLLGRPPQRHLVFPDHHAFSAKDRERIRSAADSLSCRTIVCTPKDAVKLEDMGDSRLACLDLRLSFGETDNTHLDFPAWLERELGNTFRGW
jgi:tetraacyldisaccharide 4'-kinase